MKNKILIIVAAILVILLLLLLAFGLKPAKDGDTNGGGEDSSQDGALSDNIFDNDPTTPTDEDTQPTTPTSSQQNSNKPSGGKTDSTTSDTKPKPTTPGGSSEEEITMDYETFQAMSGTEQKTFVETFKTTDDFFTWLNKAKADYEKEHSSIIIGDDGTVDVDDILK